MILHLCLLPYDNAGVRDLLLAKIAAFPSLEASELFTGMRGSGY